MENTVDEIQQSAFAVTRWMIDLLNSWGVSTELTNFLLMLLQLTIVILLTYFIQWIGKKLITFILKRTGRIKRLKISNDLINNKFPIYVALFLPMSWLLNTIPVVFEKFPKIEAFIDVLMGLFIIYIIYSIIVSTIKSVVDYLKTFDKYKDKPVESYFQVFRIIVVIFTVGAVFTVLTGAKFKDFFTAMGAASAVMMLVFKDTILGFVASVQVTTNDMVRIGDWITMPKYDADGDVTQITLNTVKIMNFDKTITTVPTYALISDSFQNWRGMQDSGGRRIKRSIFIKQSSIHYVGNEELPRFERIQNIQKYIAERQAVIQEHNDSIGADRSVAINGRNLTNIGLFRKYTENYLRSHPDLKKNMTLMVRQLAPTPQGLPLEIYCFTDTTQWVSYENIMADVFDHLTAAVRYFDLEIFEQTSSNDKRFVVMEAAPEKE